MAPFRDRLRVLGQTQETTRKSRPPFLVRRWFSGATAGLPPLRVAVLLLLGGAVLPDTLDAQTVLDRDIDLARIELQPEPDLGTLKLYSQSDFAWLASSPAGRGDSMAQCGCELAVVATVMRYLLNGVSVPRSFSDIVSLVGVPPFVQIGFRHVLEFNPVYVNEFLSSPANGKGRNWGFKTDGVGTCGVFIRPNALARAAVPLFPFVSAVTGLRFRTAPTKLDARVREVAGADVWLRAERSGIGSGRLYTVTAAARDLAANLVTVSATCRVPHDQSGKGADQK